MPLTIRTANCALVRYDGGHTYVDRADGHARREVYLELKGVRDLDHARDIAVEVIRHHQQTRETFALRGGVYEAAQIPTTGYGLGDSMDGSPILSLSISGDDLGQPTVVPALGDTYGIWEEAMDRRIARWASGAASEWGAPTTNQQDQGKGSDASPPDISQSGTVEATLSTPWVVPRPFHVSWLEATLRVPGATPTRVRLYATDLDGITRPVAGATLAAGDDRAVVVVNRGFPAKWKLILGVDLAGASAQDLSAALRGAMV